MGFTQVLEKVCSLPSDLSESSGLVALSSNLFISHNDGGNAPELFLFDSSGILERTIYIANVKNTDWEDMAMDDSGNLYIGDFGNNNQTRKDLKIYKILPMNMWQSDTVYADSIVFSFADQKQYPPTKNRLVYDCEAMACANDSIYLFTKNWSDPFSGYTYMYVLPAEVGEYDLHPRDSASLGNIKEFYWVTGACVRNHHLYLIGTTFVWDFDWSVVKQLNTWKTYETKHISQKEAIDILDDNIYITDENTGEFGNLYRMTVPKNSGVSESLKRFEVQLVKNGHGWVLLNPSSVKLSIELFSMDGKRLGQIHSTFEVILVEEKFISLCTLKPGLYGLHITGSDGPLFDSKITITE